MTVNVYNLKLLTTRLASILRGVWLIAIAPGAPGWGVLGGGGGGGVWGRGGILSHHQLHFRLIDASR